MLHKLRKWSKHVSGVTLLRRDMRRTVKALTDKVGATWVYRAYMRYTYMYMYMHMYMYMYMYMYIYIYIYIYIMGFV